MNLFIYTGASRLNAAVVESATDLTAVSRLPDLIVGDSEPVTVKFLSASGAYESWSGGGTYTLSISIGALGGDGIAAYFQTSSFTAVTNGWTGRLNLASGSLPSVVAGYLAERPGAQSVPLFVQVRVTDADGNTETYARQAVSVSGAVSVPTTSNSTPVTYATAADVAADAATASAAAIAAAASASAASGSASTAAGHVTTAGNSATAAAASAVTAGNSATTASGHATTATTQATNAATSSSNASTYKDAAAVSAASATSSAGTATTQAAAASASATAAGISAAAALVSEAAALVSKNAANASAATASAVVGSGNGTFSAAALTGVNSVTAAAATNLTLNAGSGNQGVAVAGTGTGATASAVNTGGLRSAGFGLSTASGGPSYFGGNVTVNALTLSGNISSTAWTTNGVRVKGVAATLTDTTSTGTVAAAYTDVLGGNTIAASNATTYTDYITAFFKEPTAGSLVTMTNKWALGGESLRIGTSTPMTVSTTGLLRVTNTTAATTTTSGALIVAGGVGVSGSIYAGSTILANGNATATNGVTTTGTLAQLYFAADTSGANVYGALLATNTEAQLKTNSNHALKLGTNNTTRITIAAGGDVSLASTTASTGSTSGALQVAGGIYAGGASVFNSTASFGGVTTPYSGVAVSVKGAVANAAIYISDAAGTTPGTTSPGVFFASSVRGGYFRNASGVIQLIDESSPGAGDGAVRTSVNMTTGAATFAGAVTVGGTVIHTLSATPASASATGTVGTMSWDANYIYICTGTNTWKRVAIATW